MPTFDTLTKAADALGAVLADLPECPARNHAEAHLRTVMHWAHSALDSQRYTDELRDTVDGHERTIAGQEQAIDRHQETIAGHEKTIAELRAQLTETSE